MQLIQGFVLAIGRWPKSLRTVVANCLGWGLRHVPNRSKTTTEFNLTLVFPAMDSAKRNDLRDASLNNLGRKIVDMLATWQRAPNVAKTRVASVSGFDLFERARAEGSVLILLPHLGNWELFGAWLSLQYPYTAMFRPLRVDSMSKMVKRARERGGNRLVPANALGVKALLKDLRSGATAIVLPDQTPKKGMGEYAPFFDVEALTPTLPYRLAKAARPSVFIAGAVEEGSAYRIFFDRLDVPEGADSRTWLTQMNRQIEGWIRQYPEQYQWEYARFRNAPDGTIRTP